jgi:uncharacterized protein (DUF305 family)
MLKSRFDVFCIQPPETCMNRISHSIAALAVASLAAVAGAALAQQATPMPEMNKKGMEMDHGMMKPIPGEPPSTAGYKTAMMKMMMEMPKFTGDADIDFMKQMRPHHQAAIDMAQVVLNDGKNAETKKLATAIIAAQKKEIATIDTWLKKMGAM